MWHISYLNPKLILPDNARVAVYQVCTTWEKNNSQMFRFPSWAQDLDLRSHHNVCCVAARGKKEVFIYLFIYFSKVIFSSIRHILIFLKTYTMLLPVLLKKTKCWLFLVKSENKHFVGLKGHFVNMNLLFLKRGNILNWPCTLETSWVRTLYE